MTFKNRNPVIISGGSGLRRGLGGMGALSLALAMAVGVNTAPSGGGSHLSSGWTTARSTRCYNRNSKQVVTTGERRKKRKAQKAARKAQRK